MSEGKAGGPKVGLDRSKVGRKKGTPNKTTKLLKDAILKAAEKAGGKGGLVSPSFKLRQPGKTTLHSWLSSGRCCRSRLGEIRTARLSQ
jgi:hypothetical protein